MRISALKLRNMEKRIQKLLPEDMSIRIQYGSYNQLQILIFYTTHHLIMDVDTRIIGEADDEIYKRYLTPAIAFLKDKTKRKV